MPEEMGVVVTHKASDFLPLTPEPLRRAHEDWRGGGLCAAVGGAAVSARPLEREMRDRLRVACSFLRLDARNALRRLYEASEGPWETDDWGYLKRFGHPCPADAAVHALRSAERRACLLRMADWLEALKKGAG